MQPPNNAHLPAKYPQNLPTGRHIAFLCIISAAFLLAYFSHPALPGNNPQHPLGWWGWFDQGEYLKAAQALRAGNLSSDNYFYPPIYPMLGALFVSFNPLHPFTILNLASFLIFAHFFVALASRHVGWPAAVAAFALSFISDKILIAVWVEPWTTTFVAAIYAFIFYEANKLFSSPIEPSAARLAALGGLGGIVFSTRPADAVALIPIFLFILWRIAPHQRTALSSSPWKRYWVKFAALVSAGLITSAIFIIFNLVVHNSLGGRYFSVSTQSNGFHFADLLEKTISIFLDSGTLYNAPDDSIVGRIYWLALTVPAVIYAIFFAPSIFRLVLAVTALQLALYLPYADLLPTGIWRFQNIHYFKWTLPYLALITVWSLWNFLSNRESTRARNGALVAAAILSAMVLATKIQLVEVVGGRLEKCPSMESNCLIITFPGSEPVGIDKLSFPTLTGDFRSTYFNLDARIAVDGRELQHVRDFRFLPSEKGVDLLFIRPIEAKHIRINTGLLRFDRSNITSKAFSYQFGLGRPAWATTRVTPDPNPSVAQHESQLNQEIDFRQPDFPQFVEAATGISGLEKWGRWSETDERGHVHIRFKKPLPKNFILELVIGAYGPNYGKPIRVRAGDVERTISIHPEQDKTPKVLEFTGVQNSYSLDIFVPEPVRPKDISSESNDTRLIGLSFVTLRIRSF